MIDCPNYITALLESIESEMERVHWNKFQEEMDSPFRNSGNVEGFDNGTFGVHAYDWRWGIDDEDKPQPVNFKYDDIEIIWYKYLGRGTMINREITSDEAVKMYDECIYSLGRGWNNKVKND